MKKSLIALAVASAVSAPAFAATSNVDVYGILNVSVNYVKFNGWNNTDIGNPQDHSEISVVNNASRIGFKGSEDLGGGLAAIWQIESGFNADETSGTLGSRNTFVGLKSDSFGTILMGKHDTPMKMVGRLVDNFGDTMADSRNILGAVGDYNGMSLFDLRTPNTIVYVSPAFSGLTVSAAYVADWNVSGTNNVDNNDQDAYSLSAVYQNGPLMAGVAYERHNDQAGATELSEKMLRVVAGYSFGNAKLGAQWEKLSSDDVNAERKAWGVFGNYTMGAITLKANYLTAGDNDGYGDSGAKQWTIGADYALSKRTTVYAMYADLNNDSNAGFGMGVGAGTSDRVDTNWNAQWGEDASVFGLGIKHSF